jgi:hypothetical protein
VFVSCDGSASGSVVSNAYSRNGFDIFYRMSETLGLGNLSFMAVSSTDCNVICSAETWLNDAYQDHNLFPTCYTVFR